MIGLLLAAQIAVVVNGPGTASACAPLEFTVAARAAGRVAPRLALPPNAAWQLLRSTTRSRVEDDGGGAGYAITEGVFVVATPHRGRVSAPPVVATLGAQRASSAAPPPVVGEGDPDEPTVLVRATLDPRGAAPARPDTVFVGQQVDYVVAVQLNAAARRRMRRNPTFFPPDMPAVLAYDVEPPAPVARTGALCFETLSYRRALFPLFAGRAAIPPAALTYAIPVSASFFSREETHELRTDSVQFVAVDPPAAGRPADYAGAVGTLGISAHTGAAPPRMGDPLVLTLRVQGSGNVKLLPRPVVTTPWATIARGGERVSVDSSNGRVRGAKEFDFLLTPRRAGPVEIGAIRYPYFDPERGAYDSAFTTPIPLDIAAASLASADTAVAERLALRRTLREERGPALPDRSPFWLLLAIAPVPAVVRRVRRGRRERADGLTAALRLASAASATPALSARELRRLYLDALRERLPGLQPATARQPLARQLRRAGVTDVTADAAERLLEQLDAAAFSSAGRAGSSPIAEAARLVAEVNAQAVRRRGGTGAARALVVALALAGGSLAALPSGVAQTFADGVRAYDAAQFTLAQRQFARVAARAPRAADAWANFGAAAWAASDSARAAAAWQRALRLEPLDDETRRRLATLPGNAELAARGYVPPLPADGLAVAALALWAAAWLALAVPPARRPAGLRPLAGGALALAVVLLAGTLELRDRLDFRGLGVVRTAGTLRETPGPQGEAVGPAALGEVGALGPREGGWVHVSLARGRAGWLPAASLLRLEDAASN